MNEYIEKLNGWGRYLRLMPHVGYVWAHALRDSHIPTRDVSLDRTTEGLLIDPLRLVLQLPKHEWFLRGYRDALQLAQRTGAQFSCDKENRILVEVCGIRVSVQTAEELLILREIFVDGVYNIALSRPAVIWDIGMNVGIASLFFASKRHVRVFGFEPFPETYAQARVNIGLNPDLAVRISTSDCGVAGSDRVATVDYVPANRGSIGLYSRPSQLPAQCARTRVEVRLRQAGAVLDEITGLCPHHDVVAKIDCEGAEYEIVSSLASGGLLGRLSAVMLEWHQLAPEHDPERLVASFIDADFTTFLSSAQCGSIGMLYAVKSDRHDRHE